MKPLIIQSLRFITGLIFFLLVAHDCSANQIPDDGCSVMKLRDGDSIYCHIKDMTKFKIFFKACGEDTDVIKSIPKNKVLLIRNSNGSFVLINLAKNNEDISNDSLNLETCVKGQTSINFGLGTGLLAFLYDLGNLNSASATASPAINFTIDYAIFNKISLGLGGVFQHFSISSYYFSELSERNNFSVRGLFYFSQKRRINWYCGLRVGYSVWNSVVDSVINGVAKYYPNPTEFPLHSIVPSIQVLIGSDQYLSEYFRLHVEIGFNAPYLIEGGITYLIK